MGNLDRLISRLNSIIGNFLVIILSILLFVVLWQVVSRYVFESPSTVTEELSRFLLMWLGMLGAAYVLGQEGHLSIDFFSSKLSSWQQTQVRRGLYFLISFLGILLIVGGMGVSQMALNLEQMTPTLNIPMGWIYSVVPVTGFLVLLYSSLFFLRTYEEKWKSQ